MAIVICRHGERLDYVNRDENGIPEWTKTAERVWDPPLTEPGKVQGLLAGKKIVEHLKNHDLPNVTRVFSSPFLRCVETAIEIVKELPNSNLDRNLDICCENALGESICDNWYRSWAILDVSDGTWGGPKNFKVPSTDLRETQIHKAALRPAGELYLSNDELVAKYGEFIHPSYSSEHHFVENWYEGIKPRQKTFDIGKFAKLCYQRYPGETILFVSHGGPTSDCYQYLSKNPVRLLNGYTSLYVLKEDGTELVTADVSHLQDTNQEDLGFATTGDTVNKNF